MRPTEPNVDRVSPVDELTQALRENPALERAIRLEGANAAKQQNPQENPINNGSEAADKDWEDA